MPEEKIPEEQLRKLAGFFLDLAQADLEDLRKSINVCDIIGAYPVFRDIHVHAERARKYGSDMSDSSKEALNKDISFIEAESFEIINSILVKCNCGKKGG